MINMIDGTFKSNDDNKLNIIFRSTLIQSCVII